MELASGTRRAADFHAYVAEQAWWLDEYALFRALHAQHGERAWFDWPAPLRGRQPGAQVILSELVAANSAYFAAYTRHRHVIRVMREAAATNPDFGRLWLKIRRGFVERTMHWLEGLQTSGQLEPGANLELLAETLGSVVEHLAYVRIALSPELPRGEALDELGRMAGEAWFLILTGRDRL